MFGMNFRSLSTKLATTLYSQLSHVIKPNSEFGSHCLTNKYGINNYRSLSTMSRNSWTFNGIFQQSNRSFASNKLIARERREFIKFSLKDGKRETVKEVTDRFFRLHWGIWIRTRAGRARHLWKKSIRRRIQLKQHVFCNAQQSKMLDTMVSKYWRRRKYYIEDPYEPYHKREEFHLTKTKPWRPEGVDYE